MSPTLTHEQSQQLLDVLRDLEKSRFVITGATDWAMLVTMTSMFGGVLLLVIGGSIGYVMSQVNRDRVENREDHKALWQAHQDCQDDCCPSGGGKK